jgi:hypothetical protein
MNKEELAREFAESKLPKGAYYYPTDIGVAYARKCLELGYLAGYEQALKDLLPDTDKETP